MPRVKATSRATYNDIKPQLGNQQQIVLSVIQSMQGDDFSRYEIGEEVNRRFPDIRADNARKRISELVKEGALVPSGERKCSITGRMIEALKLPGTTPTMRLPLDELDFDLLPIVYPTCGAKPQPQPPKRPNLIQVSCHMIGSSVFEGTLIVETEADRLFKSWEA